VRAYERLRSLGESDHLVLLSQLYGNDVSRFAGHLSTVNLAVRQIAREQNYPRVGTRDFFELDPGGELVQLPLGPGAPLQRGPVNIPSKLHAVIGNPPYVRRQGIDARTKRRAELAVKKYGVEHGRPAFKLDGLSDLHVYFWPHATRYLEEGGYLALLTSSAWLHTRYGEQLKKLLLADYDIVFIAETNAEPWFSDARVKTVATVARKRAPHTGPPPGREVFFAQFRRPLLELLGPPTAADRWQRVEDLLADMQRVKTGDELRVRSVKQADLDPYADWSPPLRAPDIYERFVALPGVTTVCSETPQPADPYVLTVGPKRLELVRGARRERWRYRCRAGRLGCNSQPGDRAVRALPHRPGERLARPCGEPLPPTLGARPRRRADQDAVSRGRRPCDHHPAHASAPQGREGARVHPPWRGAQRAPARVHRPAQVHDQPERLSQRQERRAGGRPRATELDLDLPCRAVRRQERRH